MKLRSSGRGEGYALWRGILESALSVLYAGGWPGALWEMWPFAAGVRETRLSRALPAGSGSSCRLALVSDIHVGPTTSPFLLERAFAVVRAADPAVLLLGGDYVYLEPSAKDLVRLATLVASVQCQVKLAVMGNHDLWSRDDLIVAALEQAGARVLINEAVSLPDPWTDVAVIGLDDPWAGRCDPASALSGLNGDAYRLVLCHSPDGLLRLAGTPFDLYLCGHTHGGHVASPWGPIVVPTGRLCRQLSGGLAAHSAGEVYVSRGIGGIEVPMRAFAPPDVLILDLVRPY